MPAVGTARRVRVNGFSDVTAAYAFKRAFYEAVRDILAGDQSTQYVLVSMGSPASLEPEDIVAFQGVTSEQNPATMGNRGREEVLTIEVQISCYSGGDDEDVPTQRAYQLLGIIERYVRKIDPTIGGTVRHCFLTGHESTGFTDPADLAKGRTSDITATFAAAARISL
jgi:hypothetical protein